MDEGIDLAACFEWTDRQLHKHFKRRPQRTTARRGDELLELVFYRELGGLWAKDVFKRQLRGFSPRCRHLRRVLQPIDNESGSLG